jgi:hypothetical protein
MISFENINILYFTMYQSSTQPYTKAIIILAVEQVSWISLIFMVVSMKRLPFALKIPNEETIHEMEDARKLNGDFA